MLIFGDFGFKSHNQLAINVLPFKSQERTKLPFSQNLLKVYKSLGQAFSKACGVRGEAPLKYCHSLNLFKSL
ncbi:MAG: hypothetical protein NC084_07435 [Bacteroides sp.]|nr:hypothetical protein [Bacteroides sp.]